MKTLILLALLMFGVLAKAHPIIMKGAQISVDYYDPKTDYFKITVTDEPGVGPNFVKARDLHHAIASPVSFQEFMKHIDHTVGSIFVLQDGIRLQTPPTSPKKDSNPSKK